MKVTRTSRTASVRRTRPGSAVALSVCLLAAVTGCTATSPGATAPPSSAAPTAASTPSSAPVERAPRLADLEAGTLIASGSFTGPAASVTGRVEIFSTGFDGITSTVSDLAYGGVEGARLAWSSREADASDAVFAQTYLYPSSPELTAGRTEFSMSAAAGLTSDPSWIRTALIWLPAPMDAGPDEPRGTALGVAPLTWTLPDMRPGLTVGDTGTRTAAAGVVTVVGDVPRTYEVVAGDVMATIGARLGVSVDDLVWLNPGRGDRFALDGEFLNLDRAARVFQ